MHNCLWLANSKRRDNILEKAKHQVKWFTNQDLFSYFVEEGKKIYVNIFVSFNFNCLYWTFWKTLSEHELPFISFDLPSVWS